MLRGAFGSFLRSANPAVYGIFFEKTGPAEQGLSTAPRPFVLRCRELGGQSFQEGEIFRFSLNVFVPHLEASVDSVTAAFTAMGDAGFGPERSRAALLHIPENVDHSIDLSQTAEPVGALRLHFLTPTELKRRDQPLTTPPVFAELTKFAYRRLDSLSALYCADKLCFNATQLDQLSGTISLVSSDLRPVKSFRRSARTGRTHPIGGLTGHVDYRGNNLSAFMPLLEAARHTGIGRHTAWGNGEVLPEKLA